MAAALKTDQTNNSPACKSSAWLNLAPSRKITSDLWGTALDIRNLSEEYLVKFKHESAEKYEERKNSSVFENEFRHSIETMAGMVFRTDPKPDELPDAIDVLMTDIDLCGNGFWSFALNAFEMFLRDGNGAIYVDAPPLKESAAKKVQAGQKLTRQDREGDRPFLVFYTASQIANQRFRQVGSREILTQVTLEEKTVEPDGAYGEKEVTRHRVLEIGSWKLLEQNQDTKEWTVEVDSGTTGLDIIPLVLLADIDTPPPMLTMAMLNVLLYNKQSDYDNICHLTCTPLRVQKYDSKEDAQAAAQMQKASPGVGIKVWGERGDVKYVEVAGTGMDRAEKRYQDVKGQIARIGVGMVAPSDMTAVRTATEVIDNAGQRQSKLSRMARNFENAMEKALFIMGEYINSIQGKNTVNLKTRSVANRDDPNAEPLIEEVRMRLKIDYDRLTFSMDQIQFFSDLVDSGKLSLETFLRWLDQVMDMPPGFDVETEMKRIAAVNSSIIVENE